MSSAAVAICKALRIGKVTWKCVLESIADHSNSVDVCAWPKVKRIREETGLSDRAIRRALAELEDAGYLTIERGARREGYANLYWVDWEALVDAYGLWDWYYVGNRPRPDFAKLAPQGEATEVAKARARQARRRRLARAGRAPAEGDELERSRDDSAAGLDQKRDDAAAGIGQSGDDAAAAQGCRSGSPGLPERQPHKNLQRTRTEPESGAPVDNSPGGQPADRPAGEPVDGPPSAPPAVALWRELEPAIRLALGNKVWWAWLERLTPIEDKDGVYRLAAPTELVRQVVARDHAYTLGKVLQREVAVEVTSWAQAAAAKREAERREAERLASIDANGDEGQV